MLSTIMQLKYNYYCQQAMTESQQDLHNLEKERERKGKKEEEREQKKRRERCREGREDAKVRKGKESTREPQYGQKGLGLEGILGGMQPKMSALMSPSRDLSCPKVKVTYSTDTKWLVT